MMVRHWAARASVCLSQVRMYQELAACGLTCAKSQVLDWKRLTKGMRWPCRAPPGAICNTEPSLQRLCSLGFERPGWDADYRLAVWDVISLCDHGVCANDCIPTDRDRGDQ